MTIKIKENQTLFDIALIHYGDANTAFAIARKNNISITDILAVGTEIELPEVNKNKAVVDFYANNNIEPATGDSRLFYERIALIGHPLTFLTLINGQQLRFIGSSVNITANFINNN